MKPKTTKIMYWSVTILFALFMFMDGIGGITRQQAGVEVMEQLGYPVYILTILGTAKILGALAVLQTRFSILKEWAYAGFTFNFIGAMLSQAIAGEGMFGTLFPLIPIAMMFLSYFLWKKVQRFKGSSSIAFSDKALNPQFNPAQ